MTKTTDKTAENKFALEQGNTFFAGLNIPLGMFNVKGRKITFHTMARAGVKLAKAVEAGLCTREEAAILEVEARAAGIFENMDAMCAYVAAKGVAAGEAAAEGFGFRECRCKAPMVHGYFFQGEKEISEKCFTQEEALGRLEVMVNDGLFSTTTAATLFKKVVDAGVQSAFEVEKKLKNDARMSPLASLIEELVRADSMPAGVFVIEVGIISGPKDDGRFN